MSAPVACPSTADLRESLLGHVPQGVLNDLQRHVLTCSHCLRQIALLEAGDDPTGLDGGGLPAGDRSRASAAAVTVLRSGFRRVWKGIAALSVVGVVWALWAGGFGSSRPVAILMTFDLTAESHGAMLVRRGREFELQPRRATTLWLDPGEYLVRSRVESDTWVSIPSRVTVAAHLPASVRITWAGELSRQELHVGGATACAFASSGGIVRVLSVGRDQRLSRWEINASGAVESIELPRAARCLAVSPDRRLVLTGGGHNASPDGLDFCRWEVASLAAAGEWAAADQRTNALAWSPSGRWIALAGIEGVSIWDEDSGVRQHLEVPGFPAAYALAWNREGTELVATGEDGGYCIWSVTERGYTPKRKGRCGEGTLRAAAWDGPNCVLAGDEGWIWRVTPDDVPPEAVGDAIPIRTLALSDDGHCLLTGNEAGQVQVWSVDTWKKVCSLTGHRGGVAAVAFESERDRVLSAGDDGTVRLWRLPQFP